MNGHLEEVEIIRYKQSQVKIAVDNYTTVVVLIYDSLVRFIRQSLHNIHDQSLQNSGRQF